MNIKYSIDKTCASVETDQGIVTRDNLDGLETILNLENALEYTVKSREDDEMYLDDIYDKRNEYRRILMKCEAAIISLLIVAPGIINACGFDSIKFIDGVLFSVGLSLINALVYSTKSKTDEINGLAEVVTCQNEEIISLSERLGYLRKNSEVVESSEDKTLTRQPMEAQHQLFALRYLYGTRRNQIIRLYKKGKLFGYLIEKGFDDMDAIGKFENFLYEEVYGTVEDEYVLKK